MSGKGLSRIPAQAVQKILARDDAQLEVFLPNAGKNQPVLYSKSGARASAPDIARIIEHGVQSLYIRTHDLKTCQQKIESQLGQILADPNVSPVEKADIVHNTGASIARDLMESPGDTACLQRSANVVETMVDGVLKDPAIATYVLQMAGHERSTASHMFIVSTLAVLLGAEVLGEETETLRALGIAGMVHDLGKLSIPVEVLNKTTPLTREELALLHQHPIESVRLVGADPSVCDLARTMVLQHHERLDGRGYPLGLPGDELHIGSKLLTIVDAFHAMVGHRSYRAPVDVARANQIMATQAGKQFDHELLAIWRRVCDKSEVAEATVAACEDDSGESGLAPTETNEQRVISSNQLVMSRRPARYECRNKTAIRCIYSGRLRSGTTTSDSFCAPVQDISRGGACILTAHAMYRGEVVYAQLTLQSRPLWVRAVVAWCRRYKSCAYRIGLRFDRRMRSDELDRQDAVEPLTGEAVGPTSDQQRDAAVDDGHDPASSDDRRNEALEQLGALSGIREPTRDDQQLVTTLAMSKDTEVRLKALDVLIEMNTPMTRDAICFLANDGHNSVQERAIAAAGALRITDATGTLHRLLEQDSLRTGLCAASALAALGDHSGLSLAARVLKMGVPEAKIATRVVCQITGHRFSANRDGVREALRYMEAKNLIPTE